MKTAFFSLLILGAFCQCSFAQNKDFRNFAWGTSLSDVQNGEKSKLVYKVKDDELLYEDQLAGTDCNVIFIFNDNDKLVSGNYFFTKKFSNPELYMQDYNKFKTLLTQKYGSPFSEKEMWNNRVPISEKTNYGQAVADGNLTLSTVWISNSTQIKISLIDKDKSPSLQIHYTTIHLDEFESKDDLKKALIKL